jgi:hypothetical protein
MKENQKRSLLSSKTLQGTTVEHHINEGATRGCENLCELSGDALQIKKLPASKACWKL